MNGHITSIIVDAYGSILSRLLESAERTEPLRELDVIHFQLVMGLEFNYLPVDFNRGPFSFVSRSYHELAL